MLISLGTVLIAWIFLETSFPFLVIAESNLPSIYLIAIATPSILGSINNRVLGNKSSKNSEILSFGSYGSGRAFLLVK